MVQVRLGEIEQLPYLLIAEEDKKNQILAALKAAHGEGVIGNVGGMSRGENSLMSVIRARNKGTDSRRNPLVETEEQRVE